MKQEKLEGIFFFDPDDRIYSDHFPGNPVVPGSLIAHAFTEAGKKVLGGAGKRYIIENFRFKRFVIPGEYAYCIEVLKTTLKCFLYDRGNIVVTGVIRR